MSSSQADSLSWKTLWHPSAFERLWKRSGNTCQNHKLTNRHQGICDIQLFLTDQEIHEISIHTCQAHKLSHRHEGICDIQLLLTDSDSSVHVKLTIWLIMKKCVTWNALCQLHLKLIRSSPQIAEILYSWKHTLFESICRQCHQVPWWDPTGSIMWGASLNGASYVLSIPLQSETYVKILLVSCNRIRFTYARSSKPKFQKGLGL